MTGARLGSPAQTDSSKSNLLTHTTNQLTYQWNGLELEVSGRVGPGCYWSSLSIQSASSFRLSHREAGWPPAAVGPTSCQSSGPADSSSHDSPGRQSALYSQGLCWTRPGSCAHLESLGLGQMGAGFSERKSLDAK